MNRLCPLSLGLLAAGCFMTLPARASVVDELKDVEKGLRTHPTPELYAREKQLLTALGAHQAAALAGPVTGSGSGPDARPDPATLTSGMRRAMAVETVRWGKFEDAQGTPPPAGTPPSSCASVYAESDRAVFELQELSAIEPGDLGVRYDLWVALVSAGRGAEAIDDWQQLGSPLNLPPWVARPLADALEQAHHSKDAVFLYRQARAKDKGPYPLTESDPRQAEAWALSDMGERREALALMQRRVHAEPGYLPLTMTPMWRTNPFALSADDATALMQADGGALALAHAHLLALSHAAPMNADLLQQMAGVELRQDRPRHATRLLDRAMTLDPVYLPTLGTRAGVDLVRHDAAGARQVTDRMVCLRPRSDLTRRSVEEFDRATGWQIDATVHPEHGAGPDTGSRSMDSELALWSPLMDDHWRVGVLARNSVADLPEGIAHRTRAGPGVRYETRNLVGWVGVLPDIQGKAHQTAVEGGLDWTASDHWAFGIDGSTASSQTPLRADAYGINAKDATVTATWHNTDMTQVRLKAGHLWFSDGNGRDVWSVDARQRVLTRFDHTLDATFEVSGSSNSKKDAPYYDPKTDTAVLGGLLWTNLFSSHDNARATQHLAFQAGPYYEAHYSHHWLAALSYGQDYAWRPGRSIGWEMGWRSQTYDGDRDHALFLSVTFHGGL